jgi:hypothetical protein
MALPTCLHLGFVCSEQLAATKQLAQLEFNIWILLRITILGGLFRHQEYHLLRLIAI